MFISHSLARFFTQLPTLPGALPRGGAAASLALLGIAAGLNGCATTPSAGVAGTTVPGEAAAAPEAAGLAERILGELAANDAAIQNFRASGKFVLKSPELQDVQVLRQSSIRFRRPADLHVVGRKYSKAVFTLTCADEGFLIVMPTESSYFAGKGVARFNGVSRSVSPKDIANEMFFPEDWGKLNPNTVVLADLNDAGDRAVLHVYESRRRDKLRRKVTVEGPRWHVVENARFDDGPEPVAITTLGNYREEDGVWFATMVESRFPSENAYMQFDASVFDINAEQEAEDFDLEAQLGEVEAKGYKEWEQK